MGTKAICRKFRTNEFLRGWGWGEEFNVRHVGQDKGMFNRVVNISQCQNVMSSELRQTFGSERINLIIFTFNVFLAPQKRTDVSACRHVIGPFFFLCAFCRGAKARSGRARQSKITQRLQHDNVRFSRRRWEPAGD